MEPKQQCASFVREELIDGRSSNSLVVWEVRTLHNPIISCYARILLKRSTPKLIHVYVIPRPNGSHKRTFPLPFFLHKFAFFFCTAFCLNYSRKKNDQPASHHNSDQAFWNSWKTTRKKKLFLLSCSVSFRLLPRRRNTCTMSRARKIFLLLKFPQKRK